MSANGGLTEGQVRSDISKLEVSPNGPRSKSSPVYGTRKTAAASNEKTSNGGGVRESGFMAGPNSKKGPRR